MADQAPAMGREQSVPGTTPGASRGRGLREVLAAICKIDRVRGGLVVTVDGFVIAADIVPELDVEPVAALAATLGRELEVGAARLERERFHIGFFYSDEGGVFVAGTAVGFLVALADPEVNVESVRAALRVAAAAIDRTWEAQERTAF